MFRIPFEQRILNMIRYAFLIRTLSDSEENQVGEIGFLNRQLRTRIVSPYGLSAVPPRGSQLVVWSISGLPNNSASMATYPQSRRRNMLEWEVSLENQKSNAELFLKDNGDADLLSPEKDVNVTADKNINLTAGQNINLTAENINLNATQSITLTVGSQTIQLTTSDITVSGQNVGITGIAGTTIAGGALAMNVPGMSHNGTNVGSDHEHVPGALRDAEDRPLTGTTGGVNS